MEYCYILNSIIDTNYITCYITPIPSQVKAQKFIFGKKNFQGKIFHKKVSISEEIIT